MNEQAIGFGQLATKLTRSTDRWIDFYPRFYYCFITTEFQHAINGQIRSLYEKINSFSVSVSVSGTREDTSLLQRRQMGAEKDAAGEARKEVGGEGGWKMR